MSQKYTQKKNATNQVLFTSWRSIEELQEQFKLKQTEMMSLLGDMPEDKFNKGIKNKDTALTKDELDRVSLLLGIYKALRTLFVDSTQALTWIKRENTLTPFDGKSPKRYLLEGGIDRLYEVKALLKFQINR